MESSGGGQREPGSDAQQEDVVYVIRAQVADRSTSVTKSTSIIGMFDKRAEADRLVEAFNGSLS